MASLAAIRNKAAQFISKGDYQKAVEEYGKALELEPSDPNTHNLLGEAFLKMNKKEQAIAEFEKAVELYTKDAFYTNSIAVCRKILRLDAERAEVYRDLGDLYTKQGLLGEAVANYLEYADRKRLEGDMEEVFSTYRKTTGLMPKKTDIRMRLVEMYLAQEKTPEAVEELKQIRAIFQEQGKVDDADGIEQKIESLTGTRKGVPVEVEEKIAKEAEVVTPPESPAPEAAEEIVIERKTGVVLPEPAPVAAVEEEVLTGGIGGIGPLLMEDSTDWAHYVELGDLCFSIGSSDEGIDYYYRAADAYYEERSFLRAEEVYLKIADLRPFELRPRQRVVEIALKREDEQRAADAWLSLGDCLRRRGTGEAADSAYEKALKVDPGNLLARQRLSHVAEELGVPYPEEKVQVEERPPVEVGVPEQYVDFGELLRDELEETSEREAREGLPTMDRLAEEFKEELYGQISEGDFSAHYDLAISYKEMGLVDDAIAEFDIASKGEEEHLKSLEMLGLCFLDKGDLKLAEEHLKRGLGVEGHTEGDRIGLRYHLGLVYAKMGRTVDAAAQYEAVYAANKNFKDISKLLAGIQKLRDKASTPEESEEKTGEKKPKRAKPGKRKTADG